MILPRIYGAESGASMVGLFQTDTGPISGVKNVRISMNLFQISADLYFYANDAKDAMAQFEKMAKESPIIRLHAIHKVVEYGDKNLKKDAQALSLNTQRR